MGFDFFLLARLVVLAICFLMVAIGASQWQFGDRSGVRYYFTGAQWGPHAPRFGYGGTCSSFKHSMRTGLAFSILAVLAISAAFVTAFLVLISYIPTGNGLPAPLASLVLALQKSAPAIRLISLMCSLVAFACLLIAWPVTESARTRWHCGVKLSQSGFGVARGLALLIASWVLMLFECILAVISLIFRNNSPSEHHSTAPTA